MLRTEGLMPVSQRFIAKVAGVSPSTVARVLSADPRARIAQETRERILRTAHALDYDFSRIRGRHRRAAEGFI